MLYYGPSPRFDKIGIGFRTNEYRFYLVVYGAQIYVELKIMIAMAWIEQC